MKRIGPILRKTAAALAGAAVVVLLMLYLVGLFHHKVPAQSPAPAFEPAAGTRLIKVAAVTIPALESAVGTIRPVYESQVASRILQKVTHVNVTAGQAVKKGDVLIRLEEDVLSAQLKQTQAAVNAAQAALNQARIEAEANRQLLLVKAAAKMETDRTEAALKTAEAEYQRVLEGLNQAQSNLAYATITAPSDGIVVDKRINVGDTVVPGTTLLNLYDPQRMQLVASVRESLAQRLKLGQALTVQIDALNATCAGKVSEIVPESASASRSFLVKVSGPCHPGVLSGMYGRLFIPLDNERIVVIPPAALIRVGQLDMVRVADAGRLEQRVVQLGRRLTVQNQPLVEVLTGLNEGQEIAMPGDRLLPASSAAVGG